MCCRFSPLFMSKSPFFGQLPMAKLYAWKREAEGQTGAQPTRRHVLYSPRPGCSRGRCGSVFAVFSADLSIVLAAALLEPPAQITFTLACPTRCSSEVRCPGPVLVWVTTLTRFAGHRAGSASPEATFATLGQAGGCELVPHVPGLLQCHCPIPASPRMGLTGGVGRAGMGGSCPGWPGQQPPFPLASTALPAPPLLPIPRAQLPWDSPSPGASSIPTVYPRLGFQQERGSREPGQHKNPPDNTNVRAAGPPCHMHGCNYSLTATYLLHLEELSSAPHCEQ